MPTRRKAAAKSSAAGAGSATAGADEESAPPPTQWAMLIKDFCTIHVFDDDDTPAAALHTEVTNDAKGIYLFAGNWGEHAILQQWADALNAFADYYGGLQPPPPINAWISDIVIMVPEWQATTQRLCQRACKPCCQRRLSKCG